jgi:ethanolamine utilization cobalamin adenosyltransferase
MQDMGLTPSFGMVLGREARIHLKYIQRALRVNVKSSNNKYSEEWKSFNSKPDSSSSSGKKVTCHIKANDMATLNIYL